MALAGGEVTFEDGTVARTYTRDPQLMTEGRQYLVFLNTIDGAPPPAIADRVGALGRYAPGFGSQGLYEVQGAAPPPRSRPRALPTRLSRGNLLP